MPRPRTLPSRADYLDQLRDLVEADPRRRSQIAEELGVTRMRLAAILDSSDLKLSTLVGLLNVLGRTLADLMPRD